MLQLQRILLPVNILWGMGQEQRRRTAFFYPNAVCYSYTKCVAIQRIFLPVHIMRCDSTHFVTPANKMRCDSTHFVTCIKNALRLNASCYPRQHNVLRLNEFCYLFTKCAATAKHFVGIANIIYSIY